MLQVFNFEWPDCMTIPILSKASRVSNLGDFEEPSLVVEGTVYQVAPFCMCPRDFWKSLRENLDGSFFGKRNTLQGTNISPKNAILKVISFSQGGIC